VTLHNRLSRRVQPQGAPGVPEPVPGPYSLTRGRCGQVHRLRPPLQPAPVRRQHPVHRRLLQHELTDHHRPRPRARLPPREHARIRVVPTQHRFVQSGEWLRRGPDLTTKLGGRSVGIVGLGRIGKAIAERVEAMHMRVAYTGRKPRDVPYRYVDNIRSLAADVDFLVIACPGGAATRHLVDAGVLAALGTKGTLINIARGSIVDEAALVRALTDGTIKGAGLDVFEDEPNVPKSLLALDNVVLLPHVGSATRETRQAMGDLCRANLDRWFAERSVLTLIPELA